MILKRGSIGPEVIKWQQFLIKQGFIIGSLDGIFGAKVESVTKFWQQKNGLTADGIVGKNSFALAGMAEISEKDTASDYYPPLPDFKYPSLRETVKMFGSFAYKNVKGSVLITDGWGDKNIVLVEIKCLSGILGAPKNGIIKFHKLGVPQLVGAFDEIVEKGLSDRIISFGGSYYPRFVRGSTTTLSNHSFGTAFDINAPENWLNRQPARIGQKGCLLELVPIFNKWGFFWGGHYRNRLDGMHFELAKLLD